ncbi:MAG: hypothetical protein AMS15_08775 [Planctomycetes bacterium DG_23]|nr:MAG: hypothetical protein AMS15_08775 [Planctomycetes bacterium DG_23]
MKAEIIAIGSELVRGQTIDTNSAWLSRRLLEAGVPVAYHTAIGDDRKAIKEAAKLAASRVHLVIVTGGLGPTKDDLTREALAELCRRPLVENKAARRDIETIIKRRHGQVLPSHLRQALIPRSARHLKNPVGSAAGFRLRWGRATIVVLPGVPREMRGMFEEGVLPWIKKSATSRAAILTKTIRTVGVPESGVDQRIGHLMGRSNPDVGTGARDGMVDVRITARGKSASETRRLIGKTEAEIKRLLGDAIYATGEDTLEGACARLLLEKKKTLAVAESATGGLISTRLISCPGISKSFLEGIVAYSNAAKVRHLGVSRNLIRRYGAVSAEVAGAMAAGARKSSGADIGLATTGIAGPTGGTKSKPLGLFFIAISSKDGTEVNEYHFRGNREQIRSRAAITALNLLWLRLK